MRDVYKDEYLSLLVFEIEKIITDYDEAARSRNIRLTDSNVRSVLSKAEKRVEGKKPSIPESNDREKMLCFMAKAIMNMIEENLKVNSKDAESASAIQEDWLAAIKGIEDSIKLRKTPLPGGRDYLDYADGFIAEARKASARADRRIQRSFRDGSTPRCWLCGKTEKLKKTECCGSWICDDEDKYVPMSFARNSCSRNHGKFTLCSYHHSEKHPGHWKNCALCRKQHDDNPEMFIYLGTNEYNFEILEDLPAYEPARCSVCSKIIRQGRESYSIDPDEKYTCLNCAEIKIPDFTKKSDSKQDD
jgi:hypothetical protein